MPIRPVAYKGSEPYIFVSYAHKDSDIILPLIQGLQDRGFRVWYDAGIEVGTEWPEYIAEHLNGSACVIAFISRNSVDSHNCRREINFAIELRKDPLVIYMEDLELPLGMRMQLGSLHAMFYFRHGDSRSFLDTLAEAAMLQPCRTKTAQAFTKQEPKPAEPELSVAECLKKGDKAYRQKDYAEAAKWYRKAAERGDGYAQIQIAKCYEQGIGVGRNLKWALEYYEKAAAQGYVVAKEGVERCKKKLKNPLNRIFG